MQSITIKSRKDVREFLNRNVGETVRTKDFSDNVLASNYLSALKSKGCLERINFGEYKILKTIKRKTTKRGRPSCCKEKDVSKIPDILNSDEDGLVILQIQEEYEKITKPDKQVNLNYLYRLFSYAKKMGIIKFNGVNNKLRNSDKGPAPKRIILTNKNITEEEWDLFVKDYIRWYSGKKEASKPKKQYIPKGSVGKTGSKIINSFTQTRKNPNKCLVESHIYETVLKYANGQKLNCLVISGPDYQRHIKKLFSTIAEKVYIIEKDKTVFRKIFNKANICPYYIDNKVDIICTDLNDIILPDCQYLDLDLMGSIKSCQEVITKHINNQLHFLSPDKMKFLTFTVSMRNDGGEKERFKTLQSIFSDSDLKSNLFKFKGDDIFGDKIKLGERDPQFKDYCFKRIPIFKELGRIVDTQVLTYQDTTAMMSVLITYK